MMERLAVMRTFNGTIPQPQSFDVSFTQKTNLRDVSFSSYLRPDDEPNRSNQEHLRCTIDDSEISIFDAQKYFNETSDQKVVSKKVSPINQNLEHITEQCDLSNSVPRFSLASSVDGYGNGRNYRTRSFHATPTASSEASWNSQTGLLSHPVGAISVSLKTPKTDKKKKASTSATWLFRPKCPCSGEKSVQIQDKKSEPKTHNKDSKIVMNSNIQTSKPEPVRKIDTEITSIKSHRFLPENRIQPNQLGQRVTASGTSGFTFPILKPSSSKQQELNSNPLEDPPRDSLEVYRPPSDELITRQSTEIQHRIDRQSFPFPASPKPRITSIITDDDVASDASSDLFEIESFSTQTTIYPMYQRRDSLDEASNFNPRRITTTTNNHFNCRRSLDEEPKTPSIAPTECYAPSEVSIDWSVTTAEGFERGSVTNFSVTASEVEEFTHMRRYEEERSTGGGGGKRRGNGLLSCRCEKAVNVVGPNPVKYATEDSGGTAATVRHGSSRPPVGNKGMGGTSRSARLSHGFAA